MSSPESSTPLPAPADNERRSTTDPAPVRLSQAKIEEMRAEVRRRLARKRQSRARTIVPYPPPRYDEVFVRGTAWLNGEDGPLP